MKVTKFEQSCLLLELDGTRILIDPGAIPFGQKRKIEDLGQLDAILFTHEHPDHFDKDAAEKYSDEISVYVNESTSRQTGGTPKVVKDGDEFEVGNFKVKVLELPHCLMPDGSEGPQNIGYLINDMFFHPGDGVNLEGLKVKYLALPITGPDVSARAAFQFARQVSAEKAFAIHYDTFGANPATYTLFAKRFNQPFELIAVEPGVSIELL